MTWAPLTLSALGLYPLYIGHALGYTQLAEPSLPDSRDLLLEVYTV